MSTMRTFYNQIKGKTLREVPAHVKPMLNKEFIKTSYKKWFDNYNEKYIQTSSITPLYHVCFGGMGLSFLIALPEELRHAKHKKEHGGH